MRGAVFSKTVRIFTEKDSESSTSCVESDTAVETSDSMQDLTDDFDAIRPSKADKIAESAGGEDADSADLYMKKIILEKLDACTIAHLESQNSLAPQSCINNGLLELQSADSSNSF